MKRDRALLFQSLLSLALVAFAGLFVVSLLTSVRLSRPKAPPEASRDLVVADRAEWQQFYDSVVGSERTPDVAPPADAVPEKRAAGDAGEVPTATGRQEDQAPSASVPPTATTTLPVTPHSASSELTAKTDAPPAPAAAPPDRAREQGVGVAVSNEPSRDQVPQQTAPSVAATENASPALATAPVPPLDATAEKSAPSTTPPATRPVPMPRPKVAAPAPAVPSAARVKQAAPQGEREPERGRPSTPPRARVALPRQRSAPQSDGLQWNGTQWVDPQHFGPPQQQSGALSYAPAPTNALPPGGPQFGPYFPYGSSPPTAQQRRAQQSRSPQPRQPAQPYNDPFGWR